MLLSACALKALDTSGSNYQQHFQTTEKNAGLMKQRNICHLNVSPQIAENVHVVSLSKQEREGLCVCEYTDIYNMWECGIYPAEIKGLHPDPDLKSTHCSVLHFTAA